MYKLYGSNGTGSASVEAALALAGADYEIVRIDTSMGEHLSENFTAVNPRQQVPALALPQGTVISEGAAMMLHLADAFPSAGLAPQPGSAARAQHDRWLIFMAVNIYEGELRKAYAERYSDDQAGAEGVRSNADSYVKRHYAILEQAIGSGPFLLGATMTMADLYLWMLTSWMDAAWLGEHCPKVAALGAAIRKDPRIAPIHQKHFG